MLDEGLVDSGHTYSELVQFTACQTYHRRQKFGPDSPGGRHRVDEAIDTLKTCAPVEAVHGNFCYDDLKEKIPAKKVLSLAGLKIGLTRGHLGSGPDTDEKSLSLFDEPLDVLVHGHTHQHHQRKMGKTLVIEPGSPLDTRFTSMRTYALLTLADTISLEFVAL